MTEGLRERERQIYRPRDYECERQTYRLKD